MRWAFWKKAPAELPASAAPWPSDSHVAVERLAHMYNSLPAPAPFGSWQAAGTRVGTDIEPVVELCVHAYQLATWFRQFADVHGGVAAGLARDAFIALIQDTQDPQDSKLAASTDIMLRAIDGAYVDFNDTSATTGPIGAWDSDRLTPFEAHLAEALLERFPQQLPADQSALQALRADLARCLAHGQAAAQRVWEPMLAAMGPFNAASYSSWRWSTEPGARERHLQRRRNNLLFALERRRVTASDLYCARVADKLDMDEIRFGMRRLFSEVLRMEVPEQWHPYLDGLRAELDDLYDRLQEVGGNVELEKLYRSCRAGLMAVWRVRLGEDTSTLDHAESVLRKYQDSRCGFAYQLTSADKPIPREEVACSLLSEPTEDIARLVASLGPSSDEMALLRRQALRSVMLALEEGYTLPEYREKLEALGVSM